jgi:hypothetical protein
MKYIIILVASLTAATACKKNTEKSEIKVTTTIVNTSSSPLIIGGTVTVTGNDSVYEKGIVISTDKNLTADSTYANFIYWPYPTAITSLYTGGWPTPSKTKATIKSKAGRGQFQINIIGSYGATTYYVKAYAKNAKNTFYGNELTFQTANFSRETRSFDFANVYWKSQFTLFDVLTDEIITPNADGSYSFWYSSNEDPRVFQTTRTASNLPGFLFYKFKTQANCQKWSDLKTKRLTPSN